MSYYLIHRDHPGFADKLHIVGSCKNHQQKELIINNYCKVNNMYLVKDRQAINEVCKGEETYVYKIADNRYIVLRCIEHTGGLFMSRYIEKHTISWLDFIFYTEIDLPLSKVEGALKETIRKKLNTTS